MVDVGGSGFVVDRVAVGCIVVECVVDDGFAPELEYLLSEPRVCGGAFGFARVHLE